MGIPPPVSVYIDGGLCVLRLVSLIIYKRDDVTQHLQSSRPKVKSTSPTATVSITKGSVGHLPPHYHHLVS